MEKPRIFNFGAIFLFAISLISLIFILIKVDPYNTTALVFVIFYLSFFIAVAGLFTLAGFYLRRLIVKNKIPFRLFKTSLRQGILISFILTGFLLLQSFRILKWWSGGIIVLVILVIEIYFGRKNYEYQSI